MAAVAAAGANSTVTINITSGFTLSSSLAQLQAANSNVTVNITGNGQTINGASSFQGIVVNGANAPTVNISSLSITNTAAIGGNGQNGQNGYYSGGLAYGSAAAAVTFTSNSATIAAIDRVCRRVLRAAAVATMAAGGAIAGEGHGGNRHVGAAADQQAAACTETAAAAAAGAIGQAAAIVT
ncbi:pectate lyase-like adhesive domain-containing protein, partial [Bradyrhizobium sp.]|uniref:pectate lyase-like adhesive domain-containing protein n=1 Tax=Bradyrhizobium sp. TaxID=376 RepID=UPI00391C19F1